MQTVNTLLVEGSREEKAWHRVLYGYWGQRVRNVRERLSLTRAQFAEKIGVSESLLSQIECGKMMDGRVFDSILRDRGPQRKAPPVSADVFSRIRDAFPMVTTDDLIGTSEETDQLIKKHPVEELFDEE
jgi:hypothetical protein